MISERIGHNQQIDILDEGIQDTNWCHDASNTRTSSPEMKQSKDVDPVIY